MERVTIIPPDATADGENPIWCEQCGDWPARYQFDHAGLCFGCAYDGDNQHGIPHSDLSVIGNAVLLLLRMDGDPDPHPEYLRGIAEVLTLTLGLESDFTDSVAGWLVEPHPGAHIGPRLNRPA